MVSFFSFIQRSIKVFDFHYLRINQKLHQYILTTNTINTYGSDFLCSIPQNRVRTVIHIDKTNFIPNVMMLIETYIVVY